jgi:hypothetical protein
MRIFISFSIVILIPISCSSSKENIVTEKRCWGVPRGCDPLVAGRFIASEKGRQGA